jgi:branched-chain amino acid transport system permease protein
VAFWLLCLAGAIVFPLIFSDPATTTVAFLTLAFAAAGSAWNIFCGYSGYIALGHAVFFGIGAFALAYICGRWTIPGGWEPFYFVPVAGIVAALVAVPIGLVALRTRRHTFVVITIAIFFIFQLLAENNIFNLTHGTAGVEFPIPPWGGYTYNLPFYYVILAILIVTVVTSWFVRHSKYGLELLAIRDDEERARGLGVRTESVKLSAFVLSAFFVGMVGAVVEYFIGSTFFNSAFDPQFDVLVALMAFLGGLGTISGPLLGALLLEPVRQYLTIAIERPGMSLVVEGLVFLVVILLLPQGIVPAVSKLLFGRRAAEVATPVAPGPAPAAPSSPPTVPTPNSAALRGERK